MIRITISYPKDDGDSDHGRVLVSNDALEVAQFMKEALTNWCVDDDLGIKIETLFNGIRGEELSREVQAR